MKRKAQRPISISEMEEDAKLEAKRDEFLQEIFDLHNNRKLSISKEQEAAIIREFEELDPEKD
jgi:hypothetical protein